METTLKDVIIIGAGPAGMFAAFELINRSPGLNILIIDKGKEAWQRKCPMKETGKCVNCNPCDIMCGIGGSGVFSDGTLNLRPDIGGELSQFTKDEKESWHIVDIVDKIFLKFGAPQKNYGISDKENEQLFYKAASVGVKFIKIRQRHIGSDNTQDLIKRFEEYLRQKRVKFMTKTEVKDLIVKDGVCRGVILTSGIEIYSKFILAAPGRIGMAWINKVIAGHRITAKHCPIDIGVRVEVPSVVMEPIVRISRDPKFHIWTAQYGDFVRTFCTNPQGFVVKENYGDFIGVNGHSLRSKKSENTNFAFLVRVELTKPLEDTSKYGESIARMATTLGGGKPIIQKLGDFRRGRRSTSERLERSSIVNTLKDVTPGNIAMVMPYRIITDIMDGLQKLNEVIPGVATDSTFLYAPEIKFYSLEIQVDKNMESSMKNLFAAGDGAGLSRDIINAAATGLLAGRGIINRISS